MALAFRGGAKVAEFFPKLTARFKALPENEQKKIITQVAKQEGVSVAQVEEKINRFGDHKNIHLKGAEE